MKLEWCISYHMPFISRNSFIHFCNYFTVSSCSELLVEEYILHCSVTEVNGCEQLAQGCYTAVPWPGLKLVTIDSRVLCPYMSSLSRCNYQFIYYFILIHKFVDRRQSIRRQGRNVNGNDCRFMRVTSSKTRAPTLSRPTTATVALA